MGIVMYSSTFGFQHQQQQQQKCYSKYAFLNLAHSNYPSNVFVFFRIREC